MCWRLTGGGLSLRRPIAKDVTAGLRPVNSVCGRRCRPRHLVPPFGRDAPEVGVCRQRHIYVISRLSQGLQAYPSSIIIIITYLFIYYSCSVFLCCPLLLPRGETREQRNQRTTTTPAAPRRTRDSVVASSTRAQADRTAGCRAWSGCGERRNAPNGIARDCLDGFREAREGGTAAGKPR